jgi:hypothetical protein
VIVTLLHGNEPSGLKAIHSLLCDNFVPQVNTKIIIASVVASLTEPVFTHRMLPGKRDLNRCFNHDEKDLQHMLANAICEEIKACQPEGIVDIHNTSGSGPSFSVSIDSSRQHQAIASYFTHRFIFTDIRLGSIMEQDFGCPIVTIEAGGSQDTEADVTAINGIRAYLSADMLFAQAQELALITHPRRLELCKESSLHYGDHLNPAVDITLRQDIEGFNFGNVVQNTPLGWIKDNDLHHFHLDAPTQRVDDFFSIVDGMLVTKKHLVLFMITTRVDIAKSDCLLYFAEKP